MGVNKFSHINRERVLDFFEVSKAQNNSQIVCFEATKGISNLQPSLGLQIS
jgi:hypothetical protein